MYVIVILVGLSYSQHPERLWIYKNVISFTIRHSIPLLPTSSANAQEFTRTPVEEVRCRDEIVADEG